MDRVAATGLDLVTDAIVEHTGSTHPPIVTPTTAAAIGHHTPASRPHAMRWPTSPDGPRLLMAPPITRCVSNAPPHQFESPPSRAHLRRIPITTRVPAAAEVAEKVAAAAAVCEPPAVTEPTLPEASVEAASTTPAATTTTRERRRQRRPHVAGGARIVMLGFALTSTFMLTAAMAAADHDPDPAPPAPAVQVPTTPAAPVVAPTGT